MASTSTFALRQFLRALQEIAGRADRRTHPQPPLIVLGGAGIFQFLLDVLDRDQALQDVLVVDDQQLFHAVLVQNFFRLLERRSHRHGDQILLGHHLADGNIEARLEAQIAIGQNADQLSIFQGDRHA